MWLIGAAGYFLMNLLRAFRGHVWLWKTRSPVPDSVRTEAANLLEAYGVRRLPRIWMIEGVGQPFVWGLVRGSIYVPPSFLSMEPPKHRQVVLAHELSHVLRFDAAVNMLQIVAQGLFWFHPFVWWANHKIRQEREKCCDEMVIARLHTTPKDYSTAIVETLVRARESARSGPSLAVAGPLRNVEGRIRTMLRPGRQFRAHPSVAASLVIATIALLIVPTSVVPTAGGSPEQPSPAAWTSGLDPGFTNKEASISGTWLLYMTPRGEEERGPDPIDVRNVGSHVSFAFWQQDYSISVSGLMRENALQLSGDSVYYGNPVSFSASGKVTGDVMAGTYSYGGSQSQTGTFRAVRGEGKKTKGWVRVVNADGEYFLDLYVWDLIQDTVRITSVAVSGPHTASVTLPVTNGTQTSISIGGTKPAAGEVYAFVIDYSNGTSEIVTASTRDTMVDAPMPLSPGRGDVVDTLTPQFSWSPPTNGCQGYYRLWVCDVNDNTVWSIYLPKEARSAVYSSDGKGFSLRPGNRYEWRLIAFDPPTVGGPDNNVWVTTRFSTR